MNILICGLGGGLDVVNCLPFKFILELNEDQNVFLGSIRPLKYKDHFNLNPNNSSLIYKQCYTINENTVMPKTNRWVDPALARLLNNEVYVFSRNAISGKESSEGLAETFDEFCNDMEIDRIVFVDGGGDSMILTEEDSIDDIHPDPFKGGDAFALEAISKMKFEGYISLITVATGLDINYARFKENLKILKNEDIFLGWTDILKREMSKDAEGVAELKTAINKYKEIAEKILYLDESDPNRVKSHTATVLYHSINEDFGVKRTYVGWEKSVNGQPGVEVLKHHAFAYEFDAKKIHAYKLKINNKLNQNE